MIGLTDRRDPVHMRIERAAQDRGPTPGLAATGSGYKAYRVRWNVFRGVEGEGLLLVPNSAIKADIVALPDCDASPEMAIGLAPGVPKEAQFARRLAESGCRVLVPALIDRTATYSGNPAITMTNQPHREFLYRAVCDAKPFVTPGALLAYHAVSGGFILGEIVHRVTGKSLREVLAAEILEPLGFRWGNYGVAEADVPQVGLNYVTGPPLLPPMSNLVTRVLSQPIDKVVEISNDPRFLTGIVPSANVITTANELSRFFEIFRRGGELDGVRVMAPETLRRALTEQSRLEIDLSLGFPTRFSYGLMLGAKVLSPYGLDTDTAFGHLGLINIMGWADPERGISGGLITSGKALLYPEVHRFYGLMQRIASEVPKVPRSERMI